MICPKCEGRGINRHSGYACDSCDGEGEVSWLDYLRPLAILLAGTGLFLMLTKAIVWLAHEYFLK
jgi:hypothetical protein